MWATYVLMLLNATTWGLLLALSPNRHLAQIGSYRFWWFDDAPWLALFLSIIVPAVTLMLPARKTVWVRGGRIALASFTLAALLPYGCMSGGGV
jgi:hypothetical protein